MLRFYYDIYILTFCHSKTSKRFFQNSPTHQNLKIMFYMAIHEEWRVFLKLRNKLSLSPVSIRILEVLKTRSRIFKPTAITMTLLIVSVIRCQQKSHPCYSKRNQKGLANLAATLYTVHC